MPIQVNGDSQEGPPLGELFVKLDKNGLVTNTKALHKSWVERHSFNTYTGLVMSGGQVRQGADLDEWLYQTRCFLADMEYLLQRPHHVFWSYVLFEQSVLPAIVSFLQHANPFYLDISKQLSNTSEVQPLYERVLNAVLRVFCRLLTKKESSTAWLTEEHLRQILYENFVVSVPMLIDLVIAVGDAEPKNAALLSKIFETALQIEPRYKNDLQEALGYYKAAFRTIQNQTENEGADGASCGLADDHLETPYDDVVLFALDCGNSLRLLLEISQEALVMSHELGLAVSIASFYDNTIPVLYRNIHVINARTSSLQWLNMARVQYLSAFRNIANQHLANVLADPKHSLNSAELFANLMTECLANHTFVVDYEHEYPMQYDMDIIMQACKDIDKSRYDYIRKAYQDEADTHTLTVAQSLATAAAITIGKPAEAAKPNSSVKANKDAANAQKAKPSNNTPTPSQAAPPKQTRDITSEIATAQNILPDLGTAFLRKLLSRYETCDEAISAFMEGNLPPDLYGANKKEVYIPPDPQEKFYSETGIRRINKYDGDKYDVMTQDQPQCLIKQGKGMPNTPKNTNELLNDKSGLQSIRHRYKEYEMVEDIIHDAHEYDDEYDDSYEAILNSESRAEKPKHLKDRLADVADVEESEESEQEFYDVDEAEEAEEKNSTGYKKNPRDFCENPEIQRERYAAARAAGGYGSKQKAGNNNGKRFDVVGAPKGQGQSKDTQVNRNKKEAHKATRANHNRKAGASYKRSRGMFPS